MGDTYKHAQFRWQIDILALLLDFKQRLIQTHNLLIILLTEVLYHRNGLASLSLLKSGCLWTHVPSDAADLISLVMTVTRHNNGVFKFIIDSFLGLDNFWGLTGVALALLVKTHHLLVN